MRFGLSRSSLRTTQVRFFLSFGYRLSFFFLIDFRSFFLVACYFLTFLQHHLSFFLSYEAILLSPEATPASFFHFLVTPLLSFLLA
ncbi:hypothetical protein HanRHA438_Chr01g0042591 [Helianthus annuus]|nr:hypothetical protein HanRHA438_Chr01g0042591 [Helianthus annuus]